MVSAVTVIALFVDPFRLLTSAGGGNVPLFIDLPWLARIGVNISLIAARGIKGPVINRS